MWCCWCAGEQDNPCEGCSLGTFMASHCMAFISLHLLNLLLLVWCQPHFPPICLSSLSECLFLSKSLIWEEMDRFSNRHLAMNCKANLEHMGVLHSAVPYRQSIVLGTTCFQSWLGFYHNGSSKYICCHIAIHACSFAGNTGSVSACVFCCISSPLSLSFFDEKFQCGYQVFSL